MAKKPKMATECARCDCESTVAWTLNTTKFAICSHCNGDLTKLILDWIAVGQLDFPEMETL